MTTKGNKASSIPSGESCHRAYRVPEGYFTDLKAQMEARIANEPQVEVQEQQSVPRISRLSLVLRPYLYMAATFVVVIGSVRMLRLVRNDLAEKETKISVCAEENTTKPSTQTAESDFAELYSVYAADRILDEDWLDEVYLEP